MASIRKISKGWASAKYWAELYKTQQGGTLSSAAQIEIEAALLDGASYKYVIQDASGQILGAIAFGWEAEGQLQVAHLGSSLKGGGRTLISKAISAAKRRQGDVVLQSSNEGAGFYRRLGFTEERGQTFRLKTAKASAATLRKAELGGTANEMYRDAALRHQIGLRRYSAGVAKRTADLLEKADRDLTEMLRARLVRFEGRAPDFTSKRWAALLLDIRAARSQALAEYKALLRGDLNQLTVMEGARELSQLAAAVPIEFTFTSVPAAQLRAIVTAQPFQGKLLKDWFTALERADQARLVQAVQLGMSQGESIDDIVRRVVGTRANKYADGILSITRRDAQAIVRTAVNHVSNSARNAVWDANAKVIGAKIWTATLDGRTSSICRARDGHGVPMPGHELPAGVPPLSPPGAQPPAHINCRSVMIATVNGEALLGDRPQVVDTRTRAKREVDFRKMARETGKPIQEIRKEWAATNVGTVPASTTYQDFLLRQSAKFQDEVLGPTRGALFRRGGLTVDQFVDRSGNELTLAQLAETQPEAFTRAGLD